MTSKAYLGSLGQANYLELIRDGLQYIKFCDHVSHESRIFIKPNLTYPTYCPGVMTSPQAIEAAILNLREYTRHIYIGDSDSGGYNRFSMDEVYRETGINQFAEKYGVKLINLSHAPRKVIHFHYKNKDFTLELPRLLTDEIDVLISMPVPKVHANTGVSLTYKNLWGCIPENRDRLRLHPYLEQVVLELSQVCKAKIAIIDGRIGLNVNGPMRGVPVKLDWLLVTDNLGAADLVVTELMQMPLENIPYLDHAKKLGFIPEFDQILLNQDLKPFMREKFYLKRQWTDLPGVMAFKSPFIAYIGYFSPIAKLLHNILYLFREPLYDYQKHSVKH